MLLCTHNIKTMDSVFNRCIFEQLTTVKKVNIFLNKGTAQFLSELILFSVLNSR